MVRYGLDTSNESKKKALEAREGFVNRRQNDASSSPCSLFSSFVLLSFIYRPYVFTDMIGIDAIKYRNGLKGNSNSFFRKREGSFSQTTSSSSLVVRKGK